MRVLGISGSLRRDSYNSALLRAASYTMPPDAELVVYEGMAELPPYNEDVERDGRPEPVQALWAQVEQADAVLIATPEYNGSIPGCLKNALDWLSRPVATNALRGKPVAILGSSTGSFGAIWAQNDLRRVLGIIGAQVVGEEKPIVYVDQQMERYESGDLKDLEAVLVVRDQVFALREAVDPQAVAA